MVEIHFLELPKFRRKSDKNIKDNSIERWLTFLEKDISDNTLRELIELEPVIQKAENKIEYISSDKKAMELYWNRETSLHERANMITSAEERKNIENATNFLKLGVDLETVSKGTGLSIDDITKLYKNL